MADEHTHEAQSAPAVYHDLVSEQEHKRINQLARDDPAEMVEYLKELCFRNYPAFNYYFLGHDAVPYAAEIWDAVEGYRFNIILLPRSHGKTMSFTFGRTIHDICYSIEPNFDLEDPRIMLLRESENEAARDVGTIQYYLESGGADGLIEAGFKDDEGNTIPEQARVWNQLEIQLGSQTSRDYTLTGYGYGGGVTGMHPKLLIPDDVVTKKNSRTEAQQKDMWDFWTKTIRGMIDPDTEVFMLGTRYYHGDLYDRLKEDEKYNIVRRTALNRIPSEDDYEAVYDENGVRTNVKITEEGEDLEALWPCPLGVGNCPNTPEHNKKFGHHRSVQYLIHEKFIEDRTDFMTQFMLKVSNRGDARIKPEMLRFYSLKDPGKPNNKNDTEIVEFPDKDEIVQVVHAWDHAIGKKSYHNNTAFCRAFRTEDNDVFLKLKAEKMGYTEAVDLMESWFESEPYGTPTGIATEAIGMQEAYSELLGKRSARLLHDKIEPIKKGNADKDLFLNESGLLQAMRHGKVYFEYEDEDALQEFLHFTPDGSSGFEDDRVDAAAMAYYLIKDKAKRKAKSWSLDISSGNPVDDMMSRGMP